MTVSSTQGADLTCEQVAFRAHQLAGLVSANQSMADAGWPPKRDMALTFLDTIVDELATEGVFARFVTFYELTLVVGTYKYTLPETVVALVGDGAYIAPGEALSAATAETPVTPISREEWQAIGSKSTTSTPAHYYAHEGTTGYAIEVRLWPIPDAAGTIRFQTQRIAADTTESSSTIDLPPFWMQYVLWELAHHLATAAGLSEARCSMLEARAHEKRDKARGHANQAQPGQVEVEH